LRKILALETAAQKQLFQNQEQALEYLAGHLKGTTPFFQVKSKDYLEKTFDVLKNEFDGKRLRGHSKDVINGRLFIKFISLILYSAIANIMREKDLFKHYSIKELLYELKKLRIVEMYNGASYLTEISKRQREIFNKLEVKIPTIGT
jgi:transposase